MSEDRLERALQEMKQEDVDAGTLQAARARVWQNVTSAGSATKFRPGTTRVRKAPALVVSGTLLALRYPQLPPE